MQSFLSGSGASLDIDTETKSNISVSKNETFERFCEWYESTDHATSSMTLFEVQKQMRDLCPLEGGVCSIKWISKRLLERYGNKIQVTASTGRPNIIMLRKEADQIVAENIPMVIPQDEIEAHTLEEPMTSHDEDVTDYTIIGNMIRECLQEPGYQNPDLSTGNTEEELYPFANSLTLEKLSAEVPLKLSSLLDAIFDSRIRTETAQHRNSLRKAAIGHIIMQWSKKQGYTSPLLLAIGLFVHQVTRSRIIIDVLYALGLSLSYTAILDFEKSAAVSTINFADVASEEDSAEIFLQFIADNFDHNEDTTTGANTTHVMGIISSQ